MLEAITN